MVADTKPASQDISGDRVESLEVIGKEILCLYDMAIVIVKTLE